MITMYEVILIMFSWNLGELGPTRRRQNNEKFHKWKHTFDSWITSNPVCIDDNLIKIKKKSLINDIELMRQASEIESV